jgi:hypothetical protein
VLTSLHIEDQRAVADGEAFGAAGAYEILNGRAEFALDPHLPLNQRVCDLALAPLDDTGHVTFSADFWILRPIAPAGASGTLLFDVLNRGNKTVLRLNGAPASNRPRRREDLGDGFLLRHGVTVAACAWQADVLPGMARMLMQVPSAPVSGPVRCVFVPDRPQEVGPLADGLHLPYEPADPNQPDATLTVCDAPRAEPRLVPRDRWAFCGAEHGRPAPGRTHFTVQGGLEPGRIYELVYRGENPPLIGLGFAAVRDFAAHLRHGGDAHDALTGERPVRCVIAYGPSQSGRFLRHFLYEGFNEDEAGRKVFDGVMSDIAGASRGSFNHRFAQPSRFDRGQEGHGFPTEVYPFNATAGPDPLTARNESAHGRLDGRDLAPKVMYTNSSAEYWGVSASLIHTDPLGERDVPPPENVRIYHFAGTQHVPGPFPVGDAGFMPGRPDPVGRFPGTPIDTRRPQRALFLALEAWILEGTPPPASCYPTIAGGTLVTRGQAAAQWPSIPGVVFPADARQPRVVDYGPEWSMGIISREPPAEGAEYRALAPALDADGNERGGVLLPEVAVPLATYTGWNYRHPDRGAPEALAAAIGSYFPFPATAGSAAPGDSRSPIDRRYESREDYLQRFHTAATDLVQRRLLLQEDVPAVLERGAAQWDSLMSRIATPQAGD